MENKSPIIAGIEAEIARGLGRHYDIVWDLLDARSLGEVRRMLRDLETERRNAVRRFLPRAL